MRTVVKSFIGTEKTENTVKKHGIRLSGSRLGRPSKNKQKNREQK